MKKWVVVLLVLLLTIPSASADPVQDGIQLDINGMKLLNEWEGETSETHDWIAVDATVTNWSVDTVDLCDVLAARLSYMDRYVFEGEWVASAKLVEPLVRLNGTLLFRLPQMVTESLENAEMTIEVDGQAICPEIAVNAASRRTAGSYEGPGFDSPEAAVEAYIEAFNEGDTEGMLSTFAIETFVDHMNSRAMAERINAFLFANLSTMPVVNDYTRGIAIARRVSELASPLALQYYTYAWPEEFGGFDGGPVAFGKSDNPGVEAFYGGFERSEFAKWPGRIQFVGFEPIEQMSAIADRYYSENSQNNLVKQAVSYGCDELTDRIARVRIGDEDYLQFMQCARYGDRWYNFSLNGYAAAVANLSNYLGGLVPVLVFEEEMN